LASGCHDGAVRSPGLLGRSIVASVLVAAVAIVATALLTLNVTQGSLHRQRAHRESADQAVVDKLVAFGLAHPDWTGVGRVLDRLAGTGRRLVLTDLHGERLAVTGPGGTTPADPSAVLNPLGTVVDAARRTVPRSYRDLGLPTQLLDQRPQGERILAAAQSYPAVAVCMRQSGDVTTSSAGLGSPIVFVTACSDTSLADTGKGAGSAGSLAALNNAVVLDEARCLSRRHVQPLVARLAAERPRANAPALASVSVPQDATAADARAWHDCATSTLTRHLSPRIAPEALLYIATTRPADDNLVDRIGRIRISAALGAILVAAVGASLLASRQVLHPVRRLTAATQEMAQGRLSTRVEIAGRDEVGTLARSFNEMAQALADAEDQRRRMVDDIAHELRTPLTNIRGYLEAGHDGVLPRDDAWTASLLEEATLLQHVVDDLQTLAQADAGRLSVRTDSTDLAGTVDLAIQAMSAYAGSREVRLERTGSAPATPHDRIRIRQVVGNLLANAIRHSPTDSVVTVEIAEIAGASGAPVTLTVRDHGPGIADEHLAHVFERFYRADPSRTRDTGGSGLGLAIVEQLVRAHGGTVTASNAPDGGAVFEVTLPREPATHLGC
jgi:two-component system sensor histidine kinase BaeS